MLRCGNVAVAPSGRDCTVSWTLTQPDNYSWIGKIQSRKGHAVARHTVSKDAVTRYATRSTKASAKIERRVVPASFERSDRVARFVAQRRPKG